VNYFFALELEVEIITTRGFKVISGTCKNSSIEISFDVQIILDLKTVPHE